MRTMTRRAFALASALTLGAGLTACGSTSGDTDPTTAAPSGDTKGALAWSFPTQDVNIWNAQLALMKPIVEEAGYEFLTDSSNFDILVQVSNWESWIARGDVKAIGGFPADIDSIVPVTAQAKAAGIPVISYAVTWDGVASSVKISNYDAGYAVGEAAGIWVADTYGAETAKVALMADTLTQLGQAQLEGLKDGLAATAAKVETFDLEAQTRDNGYTAAQTHLVAQPDTVVWLGIGADMVHGARQALIDSGVAPTEERYYVSATDADDEALDLIATGTDLWRTSFAWKASDLAEANAAQLIAAAEGTQIDDVEVGVSQVTKDNVDEFRS